MEYIVAFRRDDGGNEKCLADWIKKNGLSLLIERSYHIEDSYYAVATQDEIVKWVLKANPEIESVERDDPCAC